MAGCALDFKSLHDAYKSGRTTPVEVVEDILLKIKSQGDDGVWIHKVCDADVRARAKELQQLSGEERAKLCLYGLPFSVKDCIDIAGLPTTSACPAYKYTAEHTNLAVQNALDAGAILIGKTNMDQFATGVVGVRSPYGVARNPFNPAYIPGGSSSGAAVSVSSGLCSFSFGTDTGGSGRVPASYNNIIGLKPTIGLFSRADMVNASRSFDTVSIYALSANDAVNILKVCQEVDPRDPLGRAAPRPNGQINSTVAKQIAVPQLCDREFFGNNDAQKLYEEGLQTLIDAGHSLVEVPFQTIFETSKMMFVGPWLAERFAAVGEFVEEHPEAIEPSVYQVIMSAKEFSAADAFNAIYKLRENIFEICKIFMQADIIAVPTVGTVYTIDQINADPIATNATNGHYLNFASMADLAAIAVPNGFLPCGIPMGMTFVGPAFSDIELAEFSQAFYPKRVSQTGA